MNFVTECSVLMSLSWHGAELSLGRSPLSVGELLPAHGLFDF